MKKKNGFFVKLFGLMILLGVSFELQALSYWEQFGQWTGSVGLVVGNYIPMLADVDYQSFVNRVASVPGSLINAVNFLNWDNRGNLFFILGGALLGAAGSMVLYKRYRQYLADEEKKVKQAALKWVTWYKRKLTEQECRIIVVQAFDTQNISYAERYNLLVLNWRKIQYPYPSSNRVTFVKAINSLLQEYFPYSGQEKMQQLKFNEQTQDFEFE